MKSRQFQFQNFKSMDFLLNLSSSTFSDCCLHEGTESRPWFSVTLTLTTSAAPAVGRSMDIQRASKSLPILRSSRDFFSCFPRGFFLAES